MLIKNKTGTNKLNTAILGLDIGEIKGTKYDSKRAIAKIEFTKKRNLFVMDFFFMQLIISLV